jgi:hypothetical protein
MGGDGEPIPHELMARGEWRTEDRAMCQAGGEVSGRLSMSLQQTGST